MTTPALRLVALVAAGALLDAPAGAQSLEARIAAAATPRVQFSYAARDGVCGNGRSFIQMSGSWYGTFRDGDEDRAACEAGPARVIVDRAGREVVSLAVYVGPAGDTGSGITDLGRVSAREASEYLFGLAEHAVGRVSRDAMLPAMIADSIEPTPRLLALARNQDASRETRRSALSWLARPMDLRERGVADLSAALVTIANDDDDNESVRRQAMRSLARLEHGAGTEALVTMARKSARAWTAREAVSALSTSGDPRARQFIRDAVARAELPDEALVAAIRGLGGDFATGSDIAVIRAAYPKLTGSRPRDAALSAIGAFGGAENVRWLMTLARDADQPMDSRRRAVQHAWRSGVPIGEFIALYDQTTDPQLKNGIMAVLVESGEPAATDKLMDIARKDASSSMRRHAVSVLARSSDERVKRFLADLAER